HTWFLLCAATCALTVAVALAWRLRANYTEYASARGLQRP
ncbi:MAG: hypothetical protein QOI28_2174, partial [Mycobacterium sp.]|nr:hypothetical protein [Mycobacterium sp.]